MRTLCLLSASIAVFTGLAFAETFTGKLLDASCYDQNKTAKPCEPTSTTSNFVLDVSGKIYRLDATGNTKATDAMKNSANRAENPNKTATGSVNAKVSGTKEGDDTIKVDTIEIQ
jgi:hypothetical protein